MVSRFEEKRASRAAARRTWPVRAVRLEHETGDDLRATTTAQDRLAMMWPLAVEAWLLAGGSMPDYERRHAPVRRSAAGASK